MASVVFEYDLTPHGIDKKIKLQLRDIVDGFTPDQKFPRDQLEEQELNKILLMELQQNKSGVINEALELGQRKQEMINDPIGTVIKETASKAYDSEAGPGVNIGTSLREITQLLPGGETTEWGKAGQGLLNTAAAIIAGRGDRSTDDYLDPKRTLTDIGVIGTDIALGAQLMKNTPNGKFTTQNLILHALKKNPALGFASVVGTNMAAKYGGDVIYDQLNEMTRFIMQLPDPDEAYKHNEKVRNIMDAREELLWTGGAMGLMHVFPLVKRLLGKTLGVSEDMKIKVGEIADESGKMVPVHENLLKLSRQYNIPLNVFSTSPSGFVKGAGGTKRVPGSGAATKGTNFEGIF